MKNICLTAFIALSSVLPSIARHISPLPLTGWAGGGSSVSHEIMSKIYDEVQSPYKYGMVVAPQDNNHKIDCPTVFQQDGKWYMTYVIYNGHDGLDGRGYTTWLSESDDLLHWKQVGCLLDYKDSGWDMNQRGGFPSLIDWNWGGDYKMNTYKGKHWMTYIGGEGTGYEGVRAPLYIGQAWTTGDVTKAHEWEAMDKPLLHINDKDAQWWEKLIQYKSTIYEDKEKTLGKRFVMYYNAGGINPDNNLKAERIGIALSNDMKHWERYPGNPVFTHEAPGIITGDAQIVDFTDWQSALASSLRVRAGERLYVMFYFSAYNPDRPYYAYNTFAVSRDLVHWQDWDGPDLVWPTKDYENLFAHKSYVLKHNGIVYHFYCAVNNDGQRGIALATSKPMGKSPVSFPTPSPTGKRTITSLNNNWKSWLSPLPTSPRGGANLNTLADEQYNEQNISKTSIPDLPQQAGPSPRGGWEGAIPHNWDDYYGYEQKKHGNLHGTAVYERLLSIDKKPGKRYFLQFEGIGTYATIILGSDTLCRHHPVGRTTYTLDITDHITKQPNNQTTKQLTVICEHPALITDMPWVCGGCSSEWGFSEGSQPLGIFRPVSLIETDEVRVEPFGVHIWNNNSCDTVYIDTEVKNYGSTPATFQLVNNMLVKSGKKAFSLKDSLTLQPGETRTIHQQSFLKDPQLWSPESPYLYRVVSMIKRDGKTTDQTEEKYGVRTIQWVRSQSPLPASPSESPLPASPRGGANLNGLADEKSNEQSISEISSPRGGREGASRASGASGVGFYLNGKKIFINGTCEYEHLLGGSHAFSPEQIESRIKQIRQAGFNAFREAHQPHNLLYQHILDRDGMLFWSQFSAHIWYDTPQFRENFKTLLRQYIKERRNSPSIILWGIQNESTLPKDFTEECANIIREMDPTCATTANGGMGRLTTTCNGGDGSDWNVIQNWSGTYGGTALNYDKELKQPNQLLNGEYGAWRTLGLHSEAPLDSLRKEKSYSEERACDLLETKVRLAESVKDSVCGHFQWIFSSHENPGRVQPDEALRMADKVGPVNYKGLVTPWEQPADAYFMYRSNYVSPDDDPMVYIVSHTRRLSPALPVGREKNADTPRRINIAVYSNCDSVCLYNSADYSEYLGRKKNSRKPGTHMLWEGLRVGEQGSGMNRLVKYNLLHAVGYRNGKAVAEDYIKFDSLPEAPGMANFEQYKVVPTPAMQNHISISSPLGCSPSKTRESEGVKRLLSREGASTREGATILRLNCGGDSYTDSNGNVWQGDNLTYSKSWDGAKASQGVINEPIIGTTDAPLFQTFRYGRHKLVYDFPIDSILSARHSQQTPPSGAGVLSRKLLVDLYFAEPWLGMGGGIKTDCEGERLFSVDVNGQRINDIDLWAEAGHAGAFKKTIEAETKDGHLIISFPEVKAGEAVISAIAVSTADTNTSNSNISLPTGRAGGESFWKKINADLVEKLPKDLLPADNEAFPASRYTMNKKGEWIITPGVAREYALRFRYKNTGNPLTAQLRIVDSKGSVLVDRQMLFPTTPKKFKLISTTTGTQINAGTYQLQLLQPGTKKPVQGIEFEYLEVQ